MTLPHRRPSGTLASRTGSAAFRAEQQPCGQPTIRFRGKGIVAELATPRPLRVSRFREGLVSGAGRLGPWRLIEDPGRGWGRVVSSRF